MNITELRKANGARGWTAIPESCPERFVSRICEMRSKALASNARIPTPDFRSIGGGNWGVDFSAPGTTQSPTLSNFLSSLGWQRTVQAALRTQADFMAALEAAHAEERRENEEFERNRAIIRTELFPWEN